MVNTAAIPLYAGLKHRSDNRMRDTLRTYCG
jgi:hypothetical protein